MTNYETPELLVGQVVVQLLSEHVIIGYLDPNVRTKGSGYRGLLWQMLGIVCWNQGRAHASPRVSCSEAL